MGLLGLGLLAVAQQLTPAKPQLCDTKLLAQALEANANIPQAIEAEQPQLKIVKSCQGTLSSRMVDKEGREYEAKTPKTIVFFKTDRGIPEIVTAKITNVRVHEFGINQINSMSLADVNDQAVRENGIIAEHGTLDGLRVYDRHLGQIRYETLLAEAAEACLGSPDGNPDYDIQASAFIDEVENSATAYLSLDLEIKNPDARVVIYYEIDGREYKSVLPLDLRPI